MNRSEEYLMLIKELDNTPPQLEYSMQRVEAKLKKEHKGRFFTVSLTSLVIFFITFILLVNSFPTFAYACGRIPLIKNLAQLVAFSPSLSAAVENEYVQPIEIEQTQNGITARIEYVIVDQKELDIFYSLDSENYNEMDANPEIKARDNSPLEGYSLISGNYDTGNGELNHITVSFVDVDMPDSMILTLKVHDNGWRKEIVEVENEITSENEYMEPDYISEFNFTLEFDPYYTSQGEELILNHNFEIDGQTLALETAEIYPTHIRLNFLDNEDNSAWLKEFKFYLVNEKKQRFDKITNGITGTGSVDSPMMRSHHLESSFFSESKSLTLYITGVTWLDKEMETVKLDLANITAEELPQGVTFVNAERKGNDWLLIFEATEEAENHSYQIWNQDYYDQEGNEYFYNSWGTTHNMDSWNDKAEQFVEKTGVFQVEITLKDYTFDTVYMSPSYSRRIEFVDPIVIEVK
ncbi:DUF4179 domain-containing protein [Clostridium grantii]|uniref:DUF4179 domain-containing protein n=1 Tax=Clostridium grantii DSM 8605 TaxID=1121316 RepID=A0A1M5WEP0_9CLOT|nr:DUF4179 domain-containing protein [Clostridium grantii]SHH86029.1 protein of unknown function [Clostridium grantii DSM 8605]